MSYKYINTVNMLLSIISITLWLDLIFKFSIGLPILFKIYLCLSFTSLTITSVISYSNSPYSINKIIQNILIFPLYPLICLGYISTSKTIASVTMPLTVLLVLVPLITFLTDILKSLPFNVGFIEYAIPYLNLTFILIAFSYSEPFVFKFLLSLNPKNMMRKESIESILWVSKQYNFIKISFWFLAILTIITTIERLSNIVYLNALGTYKDIVIQSLITLVAVDRAIDKTFLLAIRKS